MQSAAACYAAVFKHLVLPYANSRMRFNATPSQARLPRAPCKNALRVADSRCPFTRHDVRDRELGSFFICRCRCSMQPYQEKFQRGVRNVTCLSEASEHVVAFAHTLESQQPITHEVASVSEAVMYWTLLH